MCTTATAKRRRRQASNGYNHITGAGRPLYHKKSIFVLQRRLQVQIDKERRMQQGKGKKKS